MHVQISGFRVAAACGSSYIHSFIQLLLLLLPTYLTILCTCIPCLPIIFESAASTLPFLFSFFFLSIYINCAKCYQLPCAVLCYVQFQIRKRSAWFVLHLCKIFPFLLSSLPVPNAIEIIKSDVVCPVWPFSLSEFRSTPCGSGSECPSCGSSRAPVSSALWPALARRSRTLQLSNSDASRRSS